MKFCQIIFLVLLLIDISSCDSCSWTQTLNKVSKVADCKDLSLDDDEKHCCYLEGKKDDKDVKGCFPLTEDDYKDMKKTIKDIEKQNNADVDKLDCKSFYLQIGIISLIFLIL